MINPAPLCNPQRLFVALKWDSYEKLEEQCIRESCRRPGLAQGTDANSNAVAPLFQGLAPAPPSAGRIRESLMIGR